MDPVTAVTLDDAVFGINRLEHRRKRLRLTAPLAPNIKIWNESEGVKGIKIFFKKGCVCEGAAVEENQ